MDFWPVGLMLAIVLVRAILARNLRHAVPWESKLEDVPLADWPTVCAWIAGGPTRLYEYAYAMLSSSGAIKNRNGVCVKIRPPLSVRQAWPRWIQQAYDNLPDALPMEQLHKEWLPYVHQWEIALLKKGYLLKPSPNVVRLYRLLMAVLAFFSLAMLFLWQAPWIMWGMVGVFWATLGAWLFFSHLPTLIAPCALLKLKAERRQLMEEAAMTSPQHMLSVLAIEGAHVLRGTPLEAHVLPAFD